jgi:hypothetical protein
MEMIRPKAVLLHARHRSADQVKGRAQIDGDDRVPFADRKILDLLDMLDAGIGHDHVDGTEFLSPPKS